MTGTGGGLRELVGSSGVVLRTLLSLSRLCCYIKLHVTKPCRVVKLVTSALDDGE